MQYMHQLKAKFRHTLIGLVSLLLPVMIHEENRHFWRRKMIESKIVHLIFAVVALTHLMYTSGQTEKIEPAQVTTVELTDTVLVADTMRFGVNLGDDNYWDNILTKKRGKGNQEGGWQLNFEGTTYRQCHFGPTQDEYGALSYFVEPDWWIDLMREHGYYTILSGPAKGTTGKIAGISIIEKEPWGNLLYFEFDKPVAPNPDINGGLLVEAFRLEDGQLIPPDPYYPGFWTSENNEIAIGDVPPGSFGHAALNLKGSTDPDSTDEYEEKRAYIHLSTHYQKHGETNGTWRIHFWAKAQNGTPTLVLAADTATWQSQIVEGLTSEWKKFEETMVISGVPEPDEQNEPRLFFKLEATDGDVLIDDIELWMEGDENPTAFRDDTIEALREFNPGVLRYNQMGGSTIDNTIAPRLQSHSYSSRGPQVATYGPYENHEQHSYSLHEMYELCEYLGCEPWYCLPGTLHPWTLHPETLHQDELANFIEYLGAPADIGYGKKRAEMGHPQPWTEVFEHIHIEFGNEAWNAGGPYQCGGYNGPDYWKDLIEVGKSSPYYTPNILFHTGGQEGWPGLNETILQNAPNADRFAVAPYIIQSLDHCDIGLLDTDEKLFRWVFAMPIRRSLDPRGSMYQNYQLARAANIELSVYEINHHITEGDAPPEPRNRIVTSIGGGINVINTMLLMLKEHGIRTQCFYQLNQHHFNAAAGEVRLWGAALNMRNGHERYRPTFLASAIANKVIGGDLVETVHSGFEPTFDATGYFEEDEECPAPPNPPPPPETVSDIPAIWSYGFVDSDNRGLILINLDVSESHLVEVRFEGTVAYEEATSWLLSADAITDNNEFEVGEPQVTVTEEMLADFASGAQVILPPHSMRVIKWGISRSLGDVSGDGNVTAFDASRVLSHVVGLITLSGEALRVADVSGNGAVTAYDAVLILQFSVGLIDSFPADKTQHISAYRAATRQLDLTLQDEKTRQIFIPVQIDEANGVLAYDLSLSYNPDILEIQEVRQIHPDDLLEYQADAGELKITLVRAEPLQGRSTEMIIVGVLHSRRRQPVSLTLNRVELNEGTIPVKVRVLEEQSNYRR